MGNDVLQTTEMKKFALLAFTAFLCGCATNKATQLVVVGNSITLHGPTPSIGWQGDWGMAAPSADKDFSHLVASTLDVPVSVYNLGIESDPAGSMSEIPPIAGMVGSRTDVVLEFGDNVHVISPATFGAAYDQLAGALAKGHSLVCVSTFWENPAIDRVIKAGCEAHGGHYAFIGDIFTNPDNPDRQSTEYSDWMVNVHPQVWGHAHIAERVLVQLQGR
ncbi:MAG: SGNH/GDSL hydrolase family protein [Terriglobales bacterium]